MGILLGEQAASIPPRMVTQVRNTDDAALLSHLRSNLLALEVKRTELLGKFEPTYRPVPELEAEIAQTRAALSRAEESQLHEEITDRGPTHEWVKEEEATLTSLGLAFGSEYLNTTFRTPDEVVSFLNIPVLAAMPQNGPDGKKLGEGI